MAKEAYSYGKCPSTFTMTCAPIPACMRVRARTCACERVCIYMNRCTAVRGVPSVRAARTRVCVSECTYVAFYNIHEQGVPLRVEFRLSEAWGKNAAGGDEVPIFKAFAGIPPN